MFVKINFVRHRRMWKFSIWIDEKHTQPYEEDELGRRNLSFSELWTPPRFTSPTSGGYRRLLCGYLHRISQFRIQLLISEVLIGLVFCGVLWS